MINYNFFHQENDLECNNIEKYFIDNYINKFKNDTYLINCDKEEFDFYTLYYLSSISQNIINWYDFKKESKVLQIELELGNITEALLKNEVDLTVVTNSSQKAKAIEKRCSSIKDFEIICARLKDIQFDCKFDYVVLIGNLPYKNEIYGEEISLKNFLVKIKELLNEDGKMLIALDNKFSVRSLSGGNDFYTGKKYDGITGYVHSKDKNYSISKTKIDNLLSNIGMNTINHYYPLPDFRLPNVIFSDEWTPNYSNFSKYEPYTIGDEQVLVSEVALFREILKENKDLFKMFTNSFFIETGKQKFDIEYKFVSYNNMRKAEYRLITKIGKEYVQKDITNVYSQKHYDEIKNNIKLLEKENYNILDSIDENNLIKSKYIDSNYMLSNVLADLVENENIDEFYNLVDEYFDNFFSRSKKITEDEETVFDKYNIKIEDKTKLNYLENGFWDATFSNCFLIDKKFYLFDQEWNEKNLPVEYIIYKAFFYDSYISKNIELETIAKKYNFLDCIEVFKDLDSVLQKEIRDDKIWKFYVNINKIDWNNYIDTFNEVNNENTRLKSENEHLKNKLIESLNLIDDIENNFVFKMRNKVKGAFRRKK